MNKIKMTPTVEIYYNDDSFYGIYKFVTSDKIENPQSDGIDLDGNYKYSSTIVGQMQRLTIGLEYTCEVEETFNKKFNQWQHECKSIIPEKPNTIDSQSKFLKTIITERQANILLDVYPNIVEMIINEEEVDLGLLKGIKQKTFDNIKDKVVENYVLSDILVMLKPLGISLNMIKKLQKDTPNAIILKKQLTTNPYILTRIRGLGFKKVDNLALSLKPELKESLFRTKAYLEFKLNDIGDSDGHTRIQLSDLDSYVKKDINACWNIYKEFIEKELEKETLLHINTETNCVGLLKNYRMEKEILSLLNKLKNSDSSVDESKLDFNKAFKDFFDQKGYELVEEQAIAVESLKCNNVSIMTGNAGSGKSSVIDVVVKAFNGSKIEQVALSAKASQRIVETTGYEAKTIHRLLKFNGKEFSYNEDNPIDTDIVIVDEASMINGFIFLSLLKAIRPGTKLFLVFDDAQLPPIGCGNIATDLLESNFSVNRLTKVHRQAEASGILKDANIIRKGINPIKEYQSNLITGDLKDMYYMFRNDRDDIFDLTVKYYMKSVDKIGIDDVCICVPRKANSKISTFEFNNYIQELLLKSQKKMVKRGQQVFKQGCKVIQKVNNYEKGVVNGEIGYITLIKEQDKEFLVKYGDKLVVYDFKDIDEIELAYALTIHSCQGSQYHTTIIPLAMDSYVLLSKELIYTAITRASKRCLMIAEPKAFDLGCKKKAGKRNTWLQNLIKFEE